MTESQWATSTDVMAMLDLVCRGSFSRRKLRLFACGVCRAWSPRLRQNASRRAVQVAERYADGQASREELRQAHAEAQEAAEALARKVALRGDRFAVEGVCFDAVWFAPAGQKGAERVRQAELFRDVFDNPFRPSAFEARWRTPTAIDIARAIYDGRRFDDLPVLGDALEEAGCVSAEVLRHCHGGADHARGCWVVDFVLGKE